MSDSVDIFNKLLRSPRVPSGRAPNVWHFDIRYIQLQPPSHMLFLFQPESTLTHTELIPIGQPPDLGFIFFPDTAEEAATEIAKALVHAFVSGMGSGNSDPPPYAPWAFTTDDRGLAKEVGAELKRLGVAAPELCEVKFAPQLTKKGDIAFANVYESIKMAVGLKGVARATFAPPTGISFTNFKLAPWVKQTSSDIDAALAYCQRLSGAPPRSADHDMQDLMNEVQNVIGVLKRRKSGTVRAEADAGDPQAAIEYSLRLQFGIQCSPSRSLSRQYLIKVILNDKADDITKSIAHSLLIDWYAKDVFESDTYPTRYIHAAAHSADEAVRLASGVSSPCVLFFALHVLEKQASTGPQPVVEFYAQYKHVWQAKAKRELEIAESDGKATLKRMKHPNRYMCANVGCPVSSDSGHMLRRCSGKCDQDKKPSYCGKDCQRADWKNHKPFCMPGAACSVIERPEVKGKGKGHSATKGGAIEVPIINPDGTTTFVSSSTMGPELLKEMKAQVEAADGPRSVPGLDAFNMERGWISLEMNPDDLEDAADWESDSDSDSEID
ncbi:hypothetical protein C8R44DRAFT_656519 [Mycena epipterygia]|nr:hypothetical protein C8R44DRAFT_656519 [Mycena epipterygia]